MNYNDYYYDNSNYYTSIDESYTQPQGVLQGLYVFSLFVWIIYLVAVVLMFVSAWKIFKKMGKNGWDSLIGGHNIVLILDSIGRPSWNFFLFLIPFYNIYLIFKIAIEFAHKFGKSTAFGIFLVLLPVIFVPILAFGKAEYQFDEPSDEGKTNQTDNFQSEYVNSYSSKEQVMPEAVPTPEVNNFSGNTSGSFPSMNTVNISSSQSTITEGMEKVEHSVYESPVATDSTLVEQANKMKIENPNFVNNSHNDTEELK